MSRRERPIEFVVMLEKIMQLSHFQKNIKIICKTWSKVIKTDEKKIKTADLKHTIIIYTHHEARFSPTHFNLSSDLLL